MKINRNCIICKKVFTCNSFDLSKPKEQRKCFNYKNLQPLTIHENRTKQHHKRGY